ncbi:hypothetical protein N657DRAFT_675127 [Parathielavia appendiculata]|uniref:Uncharacterized protein n=1 Tax=Parathielavia appendiculata TaxID=2587402 RepID=A0AAN6TR37_9PEZI|nr:hypothetical protein N657DRAFT_675127 [Parathielavia appendiculata]
MSVAYESADSVGVSLGADGNSPCSELFDFFAMLQWPMSIQCSRGSISRRFSTSSDPCFGYHGYLAWVVQELASARRDPLMVFGHRQTDARTLWRDLDLISERLKANLNSKIPWMSEWECRKHGLGKREEASSRTRTGHVLASAPHPLIEIGHPRDQVYALNSLMMEHFRTALVPDYNLSRAAAYTKTRFFPVGHDPEVPPWVPDFSLRLPSDLLPTTNYCGGWLHGSTWSARRLLRHRGSVGNPMYRLRQVIWVKIFMLSPLTASFSTHENPV